MAIFSASVRGLCRFSRTRVPEMKTDAESRRNSGRRWMLLAGVLLLSSLTMAQNAPQVTGVDPASGKVNDTITVSRIVTLFKVS